MVDVISNGRLRLGVGMAQLPGRSSSSTASTPRRRSRASRRRSRSSSGPGRARRSTSTASTSTSRARRSRRSPVGAELWLGAMSEPGVRRAARFGCPWATDPLHNVDVMKYWTDALPRRPARSTGPPTSSSVVPAARRLGGRLPRRGRAGLVAVHPQRALVLLRAGPALGRRARAVPRRASRRRRTSSSTATGSTGSSSAARRTASSRSGSSSDGARHRVPDHVLPGRRRARASRRSSSASGASARDVIPAFKGG